MTPATASDEKRRTIAAFDRALQREAHVLAQRPGLVWQQFHNRLQWDEGPVHLKVVAERRRHASEGWLQLLEPFVESGALLRTLIPGVVEMYEERLASGRVGIGRPMLWSCAISPDGTWAVAGSSDGMLRFWDLATGAERHAVKAHQDACVACSVSPDGRFVVSAGDSVLRLWDPITGDKLGTLSGDRLGVSGHAVGTSACVVSPDARRIVSGGRDGTVRIWDVATSKQLAVLVGHEAPVADCAISPDGTRIISVGFDGTLRLWSLPTGKQMSVLGHLPGRPTGCAIGAGGRLAVSSSGDQFNGAEFREEVAQSGRGLDPRISTLRSLQVWDLETGVQLHTLRGHLAPVMGCTISPDESYVISAGLDRMLKLWNPLTGEEVATLVGHSGPVSSCAVSADGRSLVSADASGVLKAWDLAAVVVDRMERTRPGHADGVTRCAVSPDGRFTVSASNDGWLKVWDHATGDERVAIPAHEGVVRDCAVGFDGSFVVSAGHDGTLRVWDPETGARLEILGAGGRRRRKEGHDGAVTACAIRDDGAFIISGGQDGTVRLWESAAGKVRAVCAGHSGAISACAISPNMRWIASGSHDGTLRLWDPENGKELAVLRHGASIQDIAVAQHGTWVASAGEDGLLKLWDPRSGAEVARLVGHRGAVLGCATGPDKQGLVSVGVDGTFRVWDSEREHERAVLVFPGDVTCVAAHPSEPVAVIGTSAGYVHRIRMV